MKRALSARPNLEFTAFDHAMYTRPIAVSCPVVADVGRRNVLRMYDIGSTLLEGANEVAVEPPWSRRLRSKASILSALPFRVVSKKPSPANLSAFNAWN